MHENQVRTQKNEFIFLILVCNEDYYIMDWTCVSCATLISVSGGDVLTDGSTETCVDTISPEGASKHFTLWTKKTCIQDNMVNLDVTVTSSTNCVNVVNSIFIRKYSECDTVVTPCELTTTNLLNDHNVCTLRCVCDDKADSCEVHLFSGMILKNVEM